MYTPDELKNLDIKPKINDISLKVLARYYEMYLNPFVYRYDIKNKNGSKSIELHFDKDNFCHLLGIERIARNAVPYEQLHNYKGKDGWDNAIIHLGIKRDDNLAYYVPKTFFVEKVRAKDEDIYLKNQEDIETHVSNRIILL